ncbi:hypothetical protein [Marinoscillum sp.]|uniref:hypothetical protein n=1 Tax=Marinoscillum sp. TaxID=2024838 RepID=UPI003873C8DD
MSVKKAVGLLGLLLILQTPSSAHSEMAGQLTFENFRNELYVKSIIDKRMLSLALMQEADCTPDQMISICGDAYLQAHIQITVNCQPVTYEKLSVTLEKNTVVYAYRMIKADEPIASIGVSSDLILKYNDHAFVRTQFAIDDVTKSFDLKASRKTIEASFIQP